MWVSIHMSMETMLGISLYSYLYLKLTKNTMSFLFHVFSSTKLENKRVEQEGPEAGGGGEAAQTMYAHVSKYKNDKIKK
jgi:hypothetical protein